MWKMSLPYLDRRSRNQNSISFPPAFAIASPSLDLGEAMAKVGGRIPLVEPELSPVPCFFAGTSAAIAALFARGRRRSAKSIQPFSLEAALIHDWVLSFRDWNASWTNWPYSLMGRIMGCSLTNGSKSCVGAWRFRSARMVRR